jgi:hypothetical protein
MVRRIAGRGHVQRSADVTGVEDEDQVLKPDSGHLALGFLDRDLAMWGGDIEQLDNLVR